MRLRALAPGLACVLLAACSTGTEYRKADVIRPMDTPPDIAFEGGEALYAVPGLEQRKRYDADEDEFVVPEPPQLRAPVEAGEEDTDAGATGADTQLEARLTRDGNGYPIIMVRAGFARTWARMETALEQAEIEVNDRNRASGLFYLRLPDGLERDDKRVRLKLSQTANGIQVAVLQRKSEALLAREPAQALLEQIHDQL
jgi:outer membrane protein assembly factor BamC